MAKLPRGTQAIHRSWAVASAWRFTPPRDWSRSRRPASPTSNDATVPLSAEGAQMSAPNQRSTAREILPVPDITPPGLVTYDAKDPDTSFPPIEELRPPAGAPNVLVVLIDDAGFGSSSAFGGPCATPNAERLAAGGLKFNRFHTTALCSPTRAALLSG